MDNVSDPFIFFQISSKSASEAFSFHQLVSSSNEHIWPRTEEQIKEYSETGELFGVRKASTGEFVGLCYVTLDEHTNEWELGGLAVDEKAQRFHLGSVLVRFAVAHTIAYQRPWYYKQTIIAHVHEDNPKPRNLLDRIGFEFLKPVHIPGDKAPVSMKRNADGNVCGDKFEFPRKAVVQLRDWFVAESTNMLLDASAQAIFEIRPGGIESLREALREAASELAG